VRDDPSMLPPWALMPSVPAIETGHILDQPAPAFENAQAGTSLVGDLLNDGADDGI
jgi:hypothetical protein